MGTRRVRRTAPLQNRLALHRFVCREFGYDDPGGMFGRMGSACGEIAPGGESDYAQALPPWPAHARVSPDRIAEYDAAIVAHGRRLRMTGEHGRTWKLKEPYRQTRTNRQADRRGMTARFASAPAAAVEWRA